MLREKVAFALGCLCLHQACLGFLWPTPKKLRVKKRDPTILDPYLLYLPRKRSPWRPFASPSSPVWDPWDRPLPNVTTTICWRGDPPTPPGTKECRPCWVIRRPEYRPGRVLRGDCDMPHLSHRWCSMVCTPRNFLTIVSAFWHKTIPESSLIVFLFISNRFPIYSRWRVLSLANLCILTWHVAKFMSWNERT